MEFLQFLLENWAVIVSALCSLTAGVITIIQLVKRNKSILINSESFKTIIAELPTLVAMAEKISGLDGDSKKEFVMNQLTLKINSMGIKATANDLLTLSNMVDSLVSLSRTINTLPPTKKPENANMNDIDPLTGV